MVGADARYAFEINGAAGSVAWNFERMNELEVGGAVVRMGPQHPDFARFQPGQGLPMSYDDLKVIEAATFLQSVADGRQRPPGVAEMLSAARVCDAVIRSCETGAWERV
jgi:predicted dehydrogenase